MANLQIDRLQISSKSTQEAFLTAQLGHSFLSGHVRMQLAVCWTQKKMVL